MIKVDDTRCFGGNTSCYHDLDTLLGSWFNGSRHYRDLLMTPKDLDNYEEHGFQGNKDGTPAMNTLKGKIMVFADMNLENGDDIPGNAFDKNYFLCCPAEFLHTAEYSDYHKYCGVMSFDDNLADDWKMDLITK